MNISVAMCTYNGDLFLEEQLRSIAAQTRQPYEVIVCDDGSTDGTEEIISAFRNAVGFPVHVKRNSINLGSTKNFEQAIGICTGDAIALCDQSFEWASNCTHLSTITVVTRPYAFRHELGEYDPRSHPLGEPAFCTHSVLPT